MPQSVRLAAVALAAAAAPSLLVPAAAATVEFSGEHRARYESLDPQFRPSLDADDEALVLRTSVDVAIRWSDWTFGAEIMDSRALMNDEGSFVNTGIVNAVEPIELQLIRRWRGTADGAESSLAFGRLTFDLGSRRLIARNRYRNTVNTFFGVDWQRTTTRGASWRAFYLKPAVARPTGRAALLDNDIMIDEPDANANLLGLYYSAPAAATGRRFETYGIAFDDDARSAPRRLTTIGARVYRPAGPGRFFYDIELIGQTGRSTGSDAGVLRSDLDHSASHTHVELGYRWPARLEPTLSLRLDRATGDSDPADGDYGRFDTLFGARRFDYGPTGIYGPFPRANLAARGLRFTVRPGSRMRAAFVYQRFELASSRDAWPTAGLADADGSAGSSLGRQLEASLAIDAMPDRLAVEVGAARFSPGTFVGASSPERAGTGSYLYAEATVTF